ncbi:MAG: hypothetical protein K6F88_05850 [Ruminococcus sp.]|nr:hypothetical protein [Ruminococcus sp.]
MKKNVFKLMSIVLTLILIVGIIPAGTFQAFAAEADLQQDSGGEHYVNLLA